jgi:hypothetical protein
MSKNFWAIIVGSVIICIGVIVAGNNVANHITSFPDMLNVATDDGRAMDTYVNDTYLSESQATAFLKLSNTDFQKLFQTGVLDTAYTTIQGQRVYSENALADYVGSNIGNGVPKK